MTPPLLCIQDLSISFGGLKAVSAFNLELERGQLQGLIGPNGAGKTTCFNLLTGVYAPTTGHIRINPKGKGATRELKGLKPHQIAQAGLARTFQNIRLFPDLSVLDNVRIGCHLRVNGSMWRAVFRTPAHVREERGITRRCMRLLNVLGLDDRAHEQARCLPYGDQRRLEIARALATEPRVLLLDEPAAGMNTQEKVELRALIRQILRDFDLTILLIEHDMGLVMDICQYITVLDHGVTIATGSPAQVQNNPKVIEAYLGEPTSDESEDDQ